MTEKQADERTYDEQCIEVLDVLLAHENSWPFRKPVDREKVRDYYDVIKYPMDLETVQKKINMSWTKENPEIDITAQDEENKDVNQEGKPDMTLYRCMDDFRGDIKQIFDNARTYNSKETIFYKYAQQLEALVKPMLNRLRDTQPSCLPT